MTDKADNLPQAAITLRQHLAWDCLAGLELFLLSYTMWRVGRVIQNKSTFSSPLLPCTHIIEVHLSAHINALAISSWISPLPPPLFQCCCADDDLLSAV